MESTIPARMTPVTDPLPRESIALDVRRRPRTSTDLLSRRSIDGRLIQRRDDAD